MPATTSMMPGGEITQTAPRPKCKVIACKKKTGDHCHIFCNLHHSVTCQKHRRPRYE